MLCWLALVTEGVFSNNKVKWHMHGRGALQLSDEGTLSLSPISSSRAHQEDIFKGWGKLSRGPPADVRICEGPAAGLVGGEGAGNILKAEII